jgi:predicted transcriptional regulator
MVYTLSVPYRGEPALPKESVFSMKLNSELRNQFMAEAAAVDRPASQLVREFMRDFVQRQRQAREHDAWFRAEIEQGMREADDPGTQRISQEDVRAGWRRQRAELMKRATGKAE